MVKEPILKKNAKSLSKQLKIKFKDISILENALIHRSYLNENRRKKLESNERLEFLGDAILEVVVTDYLFHNYSEPEGVLTNWRSSLVNGEQLAARAEDLQIYDFLYMSRGESQDNNKKARSYILANALEAVIGAIYLDQGYEVTKKFIHDNLIINLAKIIEDKAYIDAKTQFQEKAQEMVSITPDYKVISESGPDHNKKFIIGVYLNKKLIAKGEGYSKQEAQTNAAVEALAVKKWRD